jgi:hypothetical protein
VSVIVRSDLSIVGIYVAWKRIVVLDRAVSLGAIVGLHIGSVAAVIASNVLIGCG